MKLVSRLGMVGMTFLAACSSTQIKESWTNPEFAGGDLGKVMVISVAQDELRRAQFETELAQALERQGVVAIPRADIAALRGKPGRKRVERVVVDRQFDHVLVSRLASIVEDEIEHVGYTEYELYGVRGRFGRYWITDVDVIEHPTYTEERTRLFVETSLFETGEGRVVWRMRTETTNPQYQDLSDELTVAITRRLRSDGLLD
jgi:hypothetical protein